MLEQFLSQRDEAAFAALLERHGPMVLSVCRRVAQDEHLAEDAFQATFLVLARKAGAIRKQQSVGSWLHGVALRLARKAMVALTEGGLKMMASKKMTLILALALFAGFLPMGVGILAQGTEPEPVEARQVDMVPAVRVAEPPLEADGPKEGAAKLDGAIANFGRVPFHNGSRIEASEMSPDGKLLATLSPRSVTVWDSVTGATLHRFFFDIPARFLYERGLAFSPDSKRLACRPTSGHLVVWDLPSGKELRRFKVEPEPRDFAFCQFSADGAALIVQLNDDVVWLSVETGAKVRQLSGLRISQLSPDEKTFAVIEESKRQVLIGEVKTGKITHTLPIAALRSSRERGVLFLPDGVTMAVVHHPEDPAKQHELKEIQFWDITTGKRRETTWPLAKADGRENYRLTLSADGKVLWFTDQRKNIRRFSVETAKELTALPLNGEYLPAVFPHPDGKVLLTVGLNDIGRWDLSTHERIPKLKDLIYWQHTAISRDGRWLALGGYQGPGHGPLELWDTEVQKIKRIDYPGSNGRTLVFSPDNKSLAVNSYSHIQFLRVPELTEMKKLTPEKPIEEASIQFSPDGRYLASSSATALLRIFDVTTDNEVWSLKESLWPLFSPDSKNILTISRDNRVLRLHEIATQKVLFEAAQPEDRGLDKGERRGPGVRVLAFSPDGRTLAVAMTGGHVCLLDTGTGKELFRFLSMPSEDLVPKNRVTLHATALAFSANGKWLAVGGQDGFLRLWEVSTRRELHRLHGHEGDTQALAFSADGRRLVSFGDGEGFLWDLRPRGERVKGPNPFVDLLSEEGPTMYRAVWTMADDPHGPAVLRATIRPKRVDACPDRIALLITDLSAEQFKIRATAMASLRELEGSARPALVGALAKSPSLEMKRRIETLLGELDTETEPALQISRAVQAMELNGSDAARKLLQDWSEGTPGLRLTEESRAVLARDRMGPGSGK